MSCDGYTALPGPYYFSANVIINLASFTDFWEKFPSLFVLDDGKTQKETFER
jgi:hypothetical protein